jgi:uncharacterized membrane protein (DUF485 family)
MYKLLLAALFSLSAIMASAAFSKDTSFTSYKEFAQLSKKEVKQQFGKDEQSKKIINTYYKKNRQGLQLLWGIVPLTGIGTYFAILSANASNGMGSTVGLVLAILFLLPAFILTIIMVASLLGRKNDYLKKRFYEELKAYFLSK